MAVSCASCGVLEETSGGPHCRLRDLAIESPAETHCANHPDHGIGRDRVPIGPVIRRASGGNVVVQPSPDTEAVRRHLIGIAADVNVRDLSELTFRQSTALWQLDAFAERRAFVHLDRIAAAISVRPGQLDPLEVKIARGLFEKIVGDQPEPETDGTSLLERLTVRGRALLLASIIAGAASFFAMVLLLNEYAAAGTRIPSLVLVVAAMLCGAAVLAGGIFLFRRAGIPFFASDAGR